MPARQPVRGDVVAELGRLRQGRELDDPEADHDDRQDRERQDLEAGLEEEAEAPGRCQSRPHSAQGGAQGACHAALAEPDTT